MNNKTSYTLLEFNNLIKKTIEDEFFDYISITAEINNLNINRSGHCYIELIQKDEISDKIIAQTRATIWAPNYRMLAPYFKSVTGKELSDGIKILFKANVNFHELYGFSVNIIDIDPNYTLGDIERQKKETITQLENDGVIEMNKELPIPMVIKNIAIISSKTAAGYEDFVTQLNNNEHNFVCHTQLFEAFMQGNNAEDSIMEAFNHIFEYSLKFDLVVFIRGGGSKSDLTVFDSYNIAFYITQFPIPVIVGIGHERDNSIADIVANISLKTPTAVADFIINNNNNFKEYIYELAESLELNANTIIDNEKHKIQTILQKFAHNSSNIIANEKYNLSANIDNFKHKINNLTKKENNKLHNTILKTSYLCSSYAQLNNNNLERLIRRTKNISNNYILKQQNKLNINQIKNESNNPEILLEKGFSYITKSNKIIKSIKDVKKGDIIKNHLKDGEIISKISSKKNN